MIGAAGTVATDGTLDAGGTFTTGAGLVIAADKASGRIMLVASKPPVLMAARRVDFI